MERNRKSTPSGVFPPRAELYSALLASLVTAIVSDPLVEPWIRSVAKGRVPTFISDQTMVWEWMLPLIGLAASATAWRMFGNRMKLFRRLKHEELTATGIYETRPNQWPPPPQ